jgi:hypothetical protein
MATEENKNAAAGSGTATGTQPVPYEGFVYLPLIAGWLVPGAGHFVLGKWWRGALLAASVLGMFATGLAMHGEIGSEVHNILDILGLAGGLGSGLLYMVARAAGWGAAQAQVTTADWGTRFIWVAGLLNVIAAVDAHNLRTGRKS